MPQKLHDAGGRAGTRTGTSSHQVAHIYGVKSVDVLFRRDGQQHAARIHLPRQRQLHQEAVDIRPLIQIVDDRQQFLGSDRVGRRQALAGDA